MSSMAAWFLYSMVVANLLGLAAVAGESALRGAGRAGRWAWAAALALSVVIPLLAFFGVGVRSVPSMPASVLIPLAPIALPPVTTMVEGRSVLGLSDVLAALWVSASATTVLFTALSWLSVRRERRTWQRRYIDGVEVMVTRNRGPAVYGLRRAEILLPEWALHLEARFRRLMLLHEFEHARAGDTRLMVFGLSVLAAAPWNLPLWWQFKRLREAIELDCDARVLRRAPDARHYGALLLEVGWRRSAPVLGVSLAEPASFLERRIRMITSRPRRARLHRILSMAWLAMALVGVAICTRDPLAARDSVPPLEPPAMITGASLGKPFPPRFTVPPRILNRAELEAAVAANFPATLRDAGVDGSTDLWLYIDDRGAVLDAQIAQSSSHAEFDAAALQVASIVRFSPAIDGDHAVAVWVTMPVTFAAGSPAQQPADEGGATEARVSTSSTGRSAAITAPGDMLGAQIERLRSQVRESMPAEPTRYVSSGGTSRPSVTAPDFGSEQVPVPELAHDNIVSLPPRPEARSEGLSTSAFTEPPRLRNGADVSRLMEREYPVLLRTSGVGGTVKVWFHIDANGRVIETVVGETSGFTGLDAAALRVAREMEFDPAINGRDAVSVWVSLPIKFSTR